jgi:isoquinoline 1-oxidoreductase alpha subunit
MSAFAFSRTLIPQLPILLASRETQISDAKDQFALLTDRSANVFCFVLQSVHHKSSFITGRGPATAESEVPMDNTLTINGEQKSFNAPSDMPLLWVLRDLLGMTGTKFGCGIALCGACTVHIDGKPVRSCMLPVGALRDRFVTTIEGIGATPAGAKVQKAWLDLEVVQCGYCQPGQIMSAAALLATTLNPDDSDIDAAMAGNICRCGTYVRIRAAIKQAASGRQS